MVKKTLLVVVLLVLIGVGISATMKSIEGPVSKAPPATVQHEAWYHDALQWQTQVAADIETIKDVETAQAAAPRIESMANNLEMMATRRQNLAKITPQESAALAEMHKAVLGQVSARLTTAMQTARTNAKEDALLCTALDKLTAALTALQLD